MALAPTGDAHDAGPTLDIIAMPSVLLPRTAALAFAAVAAATTSGTTVAVATDLADALHSTGCAMPAAAKALGESWAAAGQTDAESYVYTVVRVRPAAPAATAVHASLLHALPLPLPRAGTPSRSWSHRRRWRCSAAGRWALQGAKPNGKSPCCGPVWHSAPHLTHPTTLGGGFLAQCAEAHNSAC